MSLRITNTTVVLPNRLFERGEIHVEDGRIVGPVRNLRFTQSYLEALACTVGVASERKTLKGFLGGVVVPAIRLDAWTFSGTTEH